MAGEFVWNGLALVPLLSLGLCLFILGVILKKNPHWVISRIFVAALLGAVFWNLGEVFATLSPPSTAGDAVVFWGRVTWTAAVIIIVPGLQLGLTSRRVYADRPPFHPADALLYAPGVILIGMIWATDEVVAGYTIQPLRANVLLADTPWGSAMALFTLLPIVVVGLLLDARRKTKDLQAKEQLKWFSIGLGIPTVLGAAFALLPLVGITNQGFPTFSVAVGLAMAVIGYGIVRYRLFDIRLRLYFRRAMILSVAAALALLFAIAILTGIQAASPGFYEGNQAAAALVAIVPTLFLFRQWELAGTWVVESAFPSLKWRESELGDVFLVTNTGLMVARHRGASALQVNEGLMVSMLTAIQDFLITTLEGEQNRSGKQLDVLSYGGTKLLIEHGEECYMVVVFDGYETEALRAGARKTLNTIHERYGPVLRQWDGGHWIREVIDPMIAEMLGPGAQGDEAAR